MAYSSPPDQLAKKLETVSVQLQRKNATAWNAFSGVMLGAEDDEMERGAGGVIYYAMFWFPFRHLVRGDFGHGKAVSSFHTRIRNRKLRILGIEAKGPISDTWRRTSRAI